MEIDFFIFLFLIEYAAELLTLNGQGPSLGQRPESEKL
jgi:hypothetical protein